MLIDCPCCGRRDNGEFTYIGDAGPRRPEGEAQNLAAMVDYVYLRDNICGRHRELWYHGMGCRRMILVVRDTKTHVIEAVHLARDVARQNQAEAVR